MWAVLLQAKNGALQLRLNFIWICLMLPNIFICFEHLKRFMLQNTWNQKRNKLTKSSSLHLSIGKEQNHTSKKISGLYQI